MTYIEKVNVRVQAETLWVGDAMYPLKNISSVAPVQFTWTQPKRRTVSGCAVIVGWLVASIVTSCIFFALGASHSLSSAAASSIGLLAQVALVVGAVVIYAKGETPARSWTYHQLRIGSGGIQQVVLNVPNPSAAHDLTQRISIAINNPDKGFSVQVENLVIGDINNQNYGTNFGNVGNNAMWR